MEDSKLKGEMSVDLGEYVEVIKNKPVKIVSDVTSVLCLISAVQLACSHPQFVGAQRKLVETMIRGMGNALVEKYPGLKPLIDAGWDPKNRYSRDVPKTGVSDEERKNEG